MSNLETSPRTGMRLDDGALDTIFRTARSYNGWLNEAVSDNTIQDIYNLMKWGPTSANASPARFLFLRSKQAKERLRSALAPQNVAKTMAAAVTVIIGYDVCFYDKLTRLFPHNTGIRDLFANSPELAEATAKRNSTLQGAYLIIAARALGLDCGPMSGFDNRKVDEEFFGAESRDEEMFGDYVPGRFKSNFLCNLGYGDPASLYPRSSRLTFGEACHLL